MMMFCIPSFANKPVEQVPDQFPNEGEEVDVESGARLFRAEGMHICWSDHVMGYPCKVIGVNYTDCGQAHFMLSRDNCCAHTQVNGQVQPNGRSVSFQVTKCTNFF